MEAKYRFAQKMILDAGDFLRLHLHDELDIEIKGHFTDLVTQLDHQVQHLMVNQILTRYPNDSIYSEEDERRSSIKKGRVWVIDPIDGTSNFIAQKNDFAILLAYFEEGVGQFGLIYDVMADKLYHGGGNFPVYENDSLLPIVKNKPLTQSLIGINTGLYAQNVVGVANLADRMLGTRSYGSAGISFSHVLSGRLLIHASYLFPWDYAAAAILGEALGYQIMRLDGKPLSYEGREYLIMLPNGQKEEIQRYLK
ncbi:TPA: inositol monophosphatase family protein [Streptococcus suis]